MVPPATAVAATRSASDSILRCREGEWFRLQNATTPPMHRFLISGPDLGIDAASSLLQLRIVRLQRSRGVQAGTGCHEGGIILSKKPPEWRLSLPQQRSAADSILRCGKGGKSTKKATAFNAVAFFLTPGFSKTTPRNYPSEQDPEQVRTEPRTRFGTGLRSPRLRPCRRPCRGARHRCRPSWRGRGY